MPAPTLTRQQFIDLNPCLVDRRRIIAALGREGGWAFPVTAAQAREAGATLYDLIWVAYTVARTDADVARRVRLWMADCAAHVLHIYERAGKSDAPRNAIVAARKFARGEIGKDDLAAARDAVSRGEARAAAMAAARDAARAAAMAAARDAAWAAARDAAWAAASDAAWAAARDAASDAAWAAEAAWQFDRLILWLSDDEPEDWPLPPRKEGDA